MTAVFVVALAVPALAGAVVLAAPGWQTADRAVRLVAVIGAAAAVVVVLGGGVETAGRFHGRPLAAVAMAGVAVLVAAARPSRSGVDVVVLVAGWQVAVLALAAGTADPSPLPLAVGVTVVALVVAFAVSPRLHAALVVAGGALVALGFAVGGESAAAFTPSAIGGHGVAAVLALAGVAAMAAGALFAGGPTVVAVVPALATAVAVTPHVTVDAAVALPFGLAAIAAAAALPRRPALAIALGGLAVLPVDPTAGVLLVAAAVVVAAVPSPLALLTAVPGAVAALGVAVGHPGVAAVGAVGALGVAGVALVALAPVELRIPRRSIPAAAAGAWLVLAPSRSTWAGPAALPHWDRGAALALAAGLLALVAVALRDGLPPLRPFVAADVVDGGEEATDPAWARRALLMALVALGIAAAALVRSSLRSV